MKFLIAAALFTTALTPAQESGTYWQVEEVMSFTHPHQVGSGYWVKQRRTSDRWWTKDGKSWFGFREQGTKPATKADEAKWKADGSPTSWTYRTEGMKIKLSTEPGEGRLAPTKGRPGFHWNDYLVSYQELQKLPADAAGLKAKITADFEEWARVSAEKAKSTAPGARIEDWTSNRNFYVAETLGRLMYEYPVSKQVRAAALQAFTSTPGVRDLGASTYALPTYKGKNNVDDQRVVVDPATVTLKSWAIETRFNGKPVPAKTSLRTFTKVGWTDQKPAAPAAD